MREGNGDQYKGRDLPALAFIAALAVIALAVIGAVIIFTGDSGSTRSVETTTVEREVAVPGPERTVTVIQQVNPPITPPAGQLGAAPPAVTGAVTTKGPWAGYTVWFAGWKSVTGAVAYKLWIDSKLTSTQAATPGDTQGVTFAVRCGVKHTFNLQPQNAAGEVGAKRASAVTWTPKAC